MTDLETIKEMLGRTNIEYEEISCHTQNDPEKEKEIHLMVERGYAGFVTQFSFSEETGQLVDLGAYE